MTSLLATFPKIAATRKRYSAGADVNGHYVPGTPTSTSITVIAPQPANGTELQLLPDGERNYTHLKVWSESELAVDDEVTIGGTDYLVVMSLNYDADGGFYKAMIREVQ